MMRLDTVGHLLQRLAKPALRQGHGLCPHKLWDVSTHACLDLNTLRLRQNGCHFADNIFTCIFFNENVWILIKISLKFVLRCPINNIPALVQIMAWCRPGDKPWPEPMMFSLLTHICVTQPQRANSSLSKPLFKLGHDLHPTENYV